jgi:hypothetical protein
MRALKLLTAKTYSCNIRLGCYNPPRLSWQTLEVNLGCFRMNAGFPCLRS